MLFDALVKLLLSVVAGVVGGVIIRWWDRARALVMVKGFTNIAARDSAPCSDSLRQMTERAQCQDGIDLLPALVSRFAGASTTDDAIEALGEIFKRSELGNAVVEGVKRSILPMARGGSAEQIKVNFEDRFDNGRFIVLF